MAARVVVTGLDELIQALLSLPDRLVDAATSIVYDAANETADELRAAYPEVFGGLRRGVDVKSTAWRGGIAATVLSKSDHAAAWEFGTEVRHTQRGFNRGKGPAHYNQGLVGIASRHRRDMYRNLWDLLVDEGFQLSGSL